MPKDVGATVDLTEISRKVYEALTREPAGRLRGDVLRDSRLMPDDLRLALRLEWRRKLDIDDVHPGMSIAVVKDICGRVAAHNQEVARLGAVLGTADPHCREWRRAVAVA